MKIGLLVAPNERSANPADLARAAEALGFESLWMPDHSVMPVHTATPLPETRPGEGGIPEIYYHMCDPFVAMAMAAAATTRLMVATGVLLVPERNPLLTANELATLDRFSGGRVILGIGAGWLREESEILGVDFAHRWTQTREYVAAMRELWTKDEASFDGRYIKFPPVRCYPKPARKGGPPVIIGSKDKNALALGRAMGRRMVSDFPDARRSSRMSSPSCAPSAPRPIASSSAWTSRSCGARCAARAPRCRRGWNSMRRPERIALSS